MTRILLCALAACAGPIGSPPPDGVSGTGAAVQTDRAPDGTYVTLVDATSSREWTHVDFETGGALDATGPWDLRFQRFHISTNGGVTGTGGVRVAPVADTAFADLRTPPDAGWISDAGDGDDPDLEPDYALDDWYDYDVATHALSPKALVWIVATAGGSMIKLEITSYYDRAGTAARFGLHWEPL